MRMERSSEMCERGIDEKDERMSRGVTFAVWETLLSLLNHVTTAQQEKERKIMTLTFHQKRSEAHRSVFIGR